MSRSEILREGREKILKQLSGEHENKAKLLTALIDIDDEMEKLRRDENAKTIKIIQKICIIISRQDLLGKLTIKNNLTKT